MTSARWTIVGCGYTGRYLAEALLARGDIVTVTRRDPAAAAALGAELGCAAVAVDLAAAPLAAGAGEVVVCLAPPADPATEMAHLLAAGPAKVVYVSSTGVYAPGGGAVVDERWPLAPTTAAGRRRVAAEAALAAAADAAGIPWIVLRPAGIHGPGRGLAERIRAGTYRVLDGVRHVSRIHVVDLVAAILAAGTTPATGFVNVADDDPAPLADVADAIAAHLGLPPPPRAPLASAPPEVAAMLTADRRISNHRLKAELGVALRYPSWRAALGDLAALSGTGQSPPPARGSS